MDGAMSNAWEGLSFLAAGALTLGGKYMDNSQARDLAQINAEIEAQRIASQVQIAGIGAPVSVAQSQYLAIAAIGVAAVVVILMVRRG